MLRKLLSLILKPKSGIYHDAIRVTPENIGDVNIPILTVHLIKQPRSDVELALQIAYKMHKGCIAHHAMFQLLDGKGDISTNLWLRVGEIKHKGVFHLMNSIDKNLIDKSILLFRFGDGKYPARNYYCYEIYLRDFKIT